METRRLLDEMPCDHVFDTEKGEELCRATGYEEFFDGTWWNEYVDSTGELHYGN
jgi:hypothetical protein